MVVPVRLFILHILETVFAYVQFGLFAELVRIRAEVPRVDLILAELNLVDVFDFGEFFVLFFEDGRGRVHIVY